MYAHTVLRFDIRNPSYSHKYVIIVKYIWNTASNANVSMPARKGDRHSVSDTLRTWRLGFRNPVQERNSFLSVLSETGSWVKLALPTMSTGVSSRLIFTRFNKHYVPYSTTPFSIEPATFWLATLCLPYSIHLWHSHIKFTCGGVFMLEITRFSVLLRAVMRKTQFHKYWPVVCWCHLGTLCVTKGWPTRMNANNNNCW